MIERGNPLFTVRKITSNQLLSALSKRLTHVSLVTARTSKWKMKQNTIEPVVCCQSERSMVNEINFRIPGLPHSVVKQAENYRVRELVKKIENHPHRKDLQRGLQQKYSYNPFSEKSKKMIQDVGNVELFELFETDPKTQCKECLSYWSEGIVHCTCGHLLKEIVVHRGFIEYIGLSLYSKLRA